MTRVDHLVLAVPKLETAVERLREEWGCPLSHGGRHPRWGSWNALLPLSGGAYLEVIAPHPDPPDHGERVFGLDRVSAPRLVTWAVRPDEGSPGPLERLIEAAAREDVDLGRILPGSRRTGEGVLLEWRLSDPFAPRMGGVVPFLIDWGGTPHPSGTARPRASLLELVLGHPEPARVRTVLQALGAGALARVVPSSGPLIRARLQTPRGEVELSSTEGVVGGP